MSDTEESDSLEGELNTLRRFFSNTATRECPTYFNFEMRTKKYPVQEFELVQELAKELELPERPYGEVLQDLSRTDSVFALPYLVDVLSKLEREGGNFEQIMQQLEGPYIKFMIDQYVSKCYIRSVALAHKPDKKRDAELKEVLRLLRHYITSLKSWGFEVPEKYHVFR